MVEDVSNHTGTEEETKSTPSEALYTWQSFFFHKSLHFDFFWLRARHWESISIQNYLQVPQQIHKQSEDYKLTI